MQQWLTNARIFTGDAFIENSHLCIEDDCIVEVSSASPDPMIASIDCGHQMLVPAFIDAQIYGGGGRLFAQYPEPESLALLAAENRNGGTAQCLVTIATQPMEVILQCLDALHKYLDEGGTGIAGLHLEGPFINVAKRGAHIADWIHEPTEHEIAKLLERAKGHLKMITVAPECCTDAVLKMLQDAEVVISAGHTNANVAQARAFASRGVHAITHLFNAMSSLHHRHPGVAMAAFEDSQLKASIIPDGIHVDYSMVRMAKQLMGDRLFYITDAVTATEEGAYQHVLHHDHYALPEGTLSGSALTMLQAVKNSMEHIGISPEESLRMASYYPAQLLGLDKHYGRIEPGKKAALLLLNNNWDLVQVFGF